MPQQIGEEKRGQILQALDALGGSANTSQLREKSGIDTHQLNYHLRVLLGEKTDLHSGEPLIESDGQEQLDHVPLAANRYRLTDIGFDTLEKIDVEDSRSHDEEIEELRAEIEQMKETFNELVDRVERELA